MSSSARAEHEVINQSFETMKFRSIYNVGQTINDVYEFRYYWGEFQRKLTMLKFVSLSRSALKGPYINSPLGSVHNYEQ